MNFRNLVMWAIIVFLTIGLYNMFKHPQNIQQKNDISFSEFLKEVDNGRVAHVNIEGNNISGVLSNGKNFKGFFSFSNTSLCISMNGIANSSTIYLTF